MNFLLFCEKSEFLRFLRFLDFWGPGGAPGGARKGAPRGPPRELWVVRKSGKPLAPDRTEVSFNAPVINKRGPRGGPGRAPFFRQVALSVLCYFLDFARFSIFPNFFIFQWILMGF